MKEWSRCDRKINIKFLSVPSNAYTQKNADLIIAFTGSMTESKKIFNELK